MSDRHINDLSPETEEIATEVESRRSLLRRSVFGLTAIGLTGFLAACGDDEDDDEGAVTGDEGAEDPGEEPGIEEETGIGSDDDETPVSEETEEAEDGN